MMFYYKDNSKAKWEMKDSFTGHWVSPIIFQCEASDILEADKKFEEAMGTSPAKMRGIGCSL